eukprot:1195683-Prorocentrum_minimum.AAC.8
MLFETPDANKYLSAAILDPETLYQKSSTDGRLFPEVLMGLGIAPGVKPHLKVYALPGQDGSTVMQVSPGKRPRRPRNRLEIAPADPEIAPAAPEIAPVAPENAPVAPETIPLVTLVTVGVIIRQTLYPLHVPNNSIRGL